MQKNGLNRIYDTRKKGVLPLKEIFLEEDKTRMMLRLNGYRTACIRQKSPLGLKRAEILKELMKTL